MALDTYEGLQSAILHALARPDDPMVAPAIPDLVRLFEAEARRRLKNGGNEHAVFINTVAGQSTIDLPDDCGEIRAADIMSTGLTGVQPLKFLAPQSSSPGLDRRGRPSFYTLFGSSSRDGRAVMRLVPVPDGVYTVGLNYLRDLPPLGDFNQTNWLLDAHPDLYYFGSLVEAEMYVGHDERVTMWLQRRDLAFASIEKADIKARWSGPLQMRADGITIAGAGSSGSSYVSIPDGGDGGNGGNGNGGNGGGGEVIVTERVKASLGQSNDLGAGSSDGNHALGGDLYVDQSGGGIWILNDSDDFVRAQYGVNPLTFDAPDGSLAANHSIAFLNTWRAAAIDPPTIPYYYIQSAVGGVPIANFIAIKAAGVQMLLTILQDKIIASQRDACDVFSIDIGEADSIGDIPDTYTGGTVTGSNKFGNQATGLIAGVNPTYPWLDLPQIVIDAAVAADGFNTFRGFKAGFEHLVRLVRRLRNWKGEPFLKPSTPILICELGEAFPGNESRRNDVFATYAGGADFDPFVYVVPTAGLPLDTSQAGGDFNNANHWTSPSQNIVGKRLFQTYMSASRAGRRDISGQNVAPRHWLQVNLNVDHTGISQSVDGAYYELSMDQLRNGLSLRVHASTIFVPNETFLIGAPDLEIRVYSLSGGNTVLACRQELTDMPNDLGSIVIGSETIEHSYVLDNVGTWRFSSIERWTLVQPPLIAGYIRGGALSTTVNAFRGYATGTIASGSIVATGTVNGVSFGTVTTNFVTSSDATYTAFAVDLQTALNAVSGESGWVATLAGAGTNLVEITGGTGHIIAVSAFTITGNIAYAGYELTEANSQSNTAYTVAASAKVLLDNANSVSPGRVILLGDAAGAFTLQCSQGGIVDKTGTVTFNPITVPAGRSIVLEPLTGSRWWVIGGSYLAA